MSELILHIGTAKTGTTSLQSFFFENRDVLKKKGVDYPQFTPQHREVYAIWRNGCFLSRYCLAVASNQSISNQVSDFEDNYCKLKDALKGNSRVLLSDECFSIYSSGVYKGLHNPEMYWHELDRIANKLGVEKITFIVYLRRQEEYVVSMWKEIVRNGFFNGSFRDYLALRAKYILDYDRSLDAISSSITIPKQIIVRSYNKVADSNESIYHDFCEVAGIGWDADFKVPEVGKNDSISFDVAEAILTCKYGGQGRNNGEKRVRNRLASMLSCRHPDPQGTTILSKLETCWLVARFAEANRRVEEKYFGGNKLFPEEFKDSRVWTPNKLRIMIYRLAFVCPEISLRTLQIINKLFRTKHSE